MNDEPKVRALPRFDLAQACEEIRAVIDRHAGTVSLAEALGLLEIVKAELIAEH